MKYPLIAAKIYESDWLIHPPSLRHIHTQFEARTKGEKAARISEDDLLDDPIPPRYVGSIAILPVHGVLGKHLSTLEMKCGGCSVDALSELIRANNKDSRIDNIIFDFRTPGGMVLGIPETAALIADCDKETIAYCDDQCCSGGLWLASACSQFFCTESAMIGSCGVYSLSFDYTKQMEEDGVKANAIYSGEYKLAGAYFKAMTDAEKAMFQSRSDMIHEKFKMAVKASHPSVDDSNLQGQVFYGDEAAQIGMVDGLVEDMDELLSMFQ